MPHPFGNMRLIWPKTLRPSATREALDAERLNEVFRLGVASGFIDDALLPALAQTTSRRLGLLAYMRGSDSRPNTGFRSSASTAWPSIRKRGSGIAFPTRRPRA